MKFWGENEVNRGQFFSQQTLKFKRLIFKIFGFRQVTFVFRKNDSKMLIITHCEQSLMTTNKQGF